jgi:DNA-binding response OmpR family regulator
LCSHLKPIVDIPVIICAYNASGRRSDPVIALKVGADDFIGGSSLYELEARLGRALRRSAHSPAAQPTRPSKIQRIGELVIDRSRREVTLGDQPVHVTPTEYRILSFLVCHPDEVVSRDELAGHLWGSPDASGSRAIDVHMRRLRAKLGRGPVPPPSIIAVRSFGYRLVADAPLGP